MRGAMDILYRLPTGQLVIGDYKTDRLPGIDQRVLDLVFELQAVAAQIGMRFLDVPAHVDLIAMPLVEVLTTSFGGDPLRPAILVEMRLASGVTGWGEVVAGWSPGSMQLRCRAC